MTTEQHDGPDDDDAPEPAPPVPPPPPPPSEALLLSLETVRGIPRKEAEELLDRPSERE